MAWKSLADLSAEKQPAKKKSKGPKLGLGTLLGQLKSMPAGLWNLGASLAPGGQKSMLPEFGKSVTTGVANLATDVGSLGIPKIADLQAKGLNALTDKVPGGDWLRATPLSERLSNDGLLPTLFQDIGTAALVAGPVAKVATGAGQAGVLGRAVGAERALSLSGRLGDATGISRAAKMADAGRLAATGNVEGAARAAAAAERAGRVAKVAGDVAHPYKFAGKQVLGPLAREFSNRAAGVAGTVAPTQQLPQPATSSPSIRAAKKSAAEVGDMGEGFGERAAVADQAVSKLAAELRQADPSLDIDAAISEAQRRVTAPGPAEQLADAGVRRTTAPGARAATALEPEGPAPRSTDMGSNEIDARARAAEGPSPLIQRAADTVAKVPGAAKGFEWLGQRIQAHELRQVTREQEILADAARRSALASPEVQQMSAAARDQILAKYPQLPDGTAVTPELADEMFADAVRQRATGVEALVEQARAAGVKDDVLVRRGIIGKNAAPAEWLEDPDLQGAIDQAVEGMTRVTAEQARVLQGGRPGAKGLEGLEGMGSNEPTMTRGDKRAMRAAQREIKRAADARKRTGKDADLAARRIARQEDAVVRAAEAIKRTEGQLAGATRTFHNTRAPEVMRSPERWAQARRDIVAAVKDTGGSTFNVTDGRLVTPFAYADDAARAAALAAGGAGTGDAALGHAVSVLDLLDDPMPVEEFFAVDPSTGATRGEAVIDQLARQFQDVFGGPGGPDLNIGTWVDNGKVYVDLSQYTINGNPITRDQAQLMGAARDQVSVMDFRSGAFLDTSGTSGLRADIASDLLNNGHAQHDRQARAYRGLVEREAKLAEEQGREPTFGDDYIDAVMEGDRRMAAFLHQTQPERFPTIDSAFKNMRAQAGKDPSKLRDDALLQTVLDYYGPGDERLFDAARDALGPEWEKYAAWYNRTNEAVERQFRGKPIRLLNGAEVDQADLIYDLIALTSTQAKPTDNLAYAFGAVRNLQKLVAENQGSYDAAVKLFEDFRRNGTASPLFKRLTGNATVSDVTKAVKAEAAAAGEKITAKEANTRAWSRIAEDPNLATNIQKYSKDKAPVMLVLLGRPVQTWDSRVLIDSMADLLGRKTAKKTVDAALRDAGKWAEKNGRTLDDLIDERGRAGAAARDIDNPTPEQIVEIGREEVYKEQAGSQAFAKMRSFRENLARPEASDAVTLDMWMARVFALNGNSFDAGRYLDAAQKMRDLASELRDRGVTVEGKPIRGHHLQALYWCYGMQEIGRLERLDLDTTAAAARDAFMDIEATWSPDADPGLLRLDDQLTGIHTVSKPSFITDTLAANELPADRMPPAQPGRARMTEKTVGGETVRTIAAGDELPVLMRRKVALQSALEEAARLREEARSLDGPLQQSKLDEAWAKVQSVYNAERKNISDLSDGADFADVLEDPRTVHLAHMSAMDTFAAEDLSLGDRLYEGFADKLRDVLFQKVSGDVRGATWVDDAGRVTMRYFETADPRTLIHERAHGLRLLLGDSDARILGEGYAGNNWDGTWTREMEEAFAEDWTRISEGRTPVRHDVGPMLQRLHDYLTMMWETVRDRVNGHRVPDQAHDLFDRTHNPERLDAVTDPAIGPFSKEAGLSEAVSRGQAVSGSRIAQVARSVPGSRAEGVADAYSAGRQGQAGLDKVRGLEARLAKQQALHDLRTTALNKAKRALLDEELPSEVRAAAAEGKAADLEAAVARHQEDPSLARTPAHLQPMWHAYTSLVDEAVAAGDDGLAQMLLEVGPQLSDVLRFAKDQGFDPQYIPKMQPAQVRRVVFEAMRLGRGRGLGMEVEAGARKTRSYAAPELMDRSIAGLVGGILDATHEAHTNALVNYLEEVVAKPVPSNGRIPDGWVPWSESKQWIMTGEDAGGITVGEGTGNMMIPKQVDAALRNYGKDYNHWVFNGIRKATQPWRTLVLPLRPAWYVNNIVGNVIMATASGVGLKDWSAAWQGYRGGKLPTSGRLESTFGHPEIAGGIAQDMATEQGSLVQGSIRNTFAAEGKVKGAANAATTTVKRLGRANEVVDNMARVAAYISGKRRGMSEADALIFAQKALVDYGDLSPFERAYIRAAVPFYAWQKGILKLAARQAWDHPAAVGIMLRLGELNRDLQQDKYGTTLPGGYANMVDTPFGNLNLNPLNPFGDAAALLTPQGIASSLNPYIEGAAREALGAPEYGIADHYRQSEIGSAEPMPNTAGTLKDLFAFAPPAQAARSQEGAIRYSGAPLYSDESLDKIILRTKKTQARMAGQTPTEAGLVEPKARKRKGLYTPPKRPSLTALGDSR